MAVVLPLFQSLLFFGCSYTRGYGGLTAPYPPGFVPTSLSEPLPLTGSGKEKIVSGNHGIYSVELASFKFSTAPYPPGFVPTSLSEPLPLTG